MHRSINRLRLSLLFLLAASGTCLQAGMNPIHHPGSPGLFYVENKGQWDDQVKFKLQAARGVFWICDDGFVYDTKQYFVTRPETKNHEPGNSQPIDSIRGHVIRIRFTNTDKHILCGYEQLPGVHNYFLGKDKSKWRSNVALYKEVNSSGIASKISTRYYVDEGTLRYDLIVPPGAEPSGVRFNIEGATQVRVNALGELVIGTSLGEITQKKLEAYQTIGSKRVPVACAFKVYDNGEIGFRCGAYNSSIPLVVDPIVWSSYVGGMAMALTGTNGQNTEDCFDMTVDAAGNPVIVGTTETNDFPTTVGAYSRIKKNIDDTVSYCEAFVTKFNANGSGLVFSTYLGGKASDWGRGICLSNDTIYVCGGTESGDFPTTSGSFSQVRSGSSDAFVAKFSPNGSTLLASTLIGGPNFDQLLSIKADNAGVYVCGWTLFDGYPTTLNALQAHNDLWWCCVASVFNKNLTALNGSTYIGGRGTAFDLAIDNSSNMYIVGVEIDTTLQTTANAYKRNRNGIFSDAYLVKINSTCTSLLYGTYIGGEDEDIAYGVCLDASSNIIVCGKTRSDNWPTTAGAYDRSYNWIRNSSRTGDPYDDYYDGFVFKLSSSYQLLYSTYIGGKSSDWFQRVTTAPNGSALLTGISYSPDYPATACCIDSTQNGVADLVFTVLNSTGSVVTYSTFLGGGGTDIAYGIARQSNGHVYLCGSSWDYSFPTTTGSYQPVRKLTDGIVLKIDPTAGFTVNAGNDIMYSCTGFGNTVYLAATPACGVGPYSYSWTPTTNLSDPHSDKPVTFTTTTGMEYKVTVTDAGGNVAVNTVSLVPLLLKVRPGSDTVVCWGRNTRLNTKVTGGMGQKTYQWYPAVGLDSSNIANPLANPDTTTMYVLIVSDTAGCQRSDSVLVRISRSRVKSTHDTTLCGLNAIKLAPRIEGGINPLAFKWTTKGSATLSTSATPTFTVDSTTMFYLAITDSLSCTSRDSILVRYSPPTALSLKADSIVCKGTPISVQVSIKGGQPPYAIRWKASDPSLTLGGKDSTVTATIQQTTTFSATVIDSLGCSTIKSVVVKVDSASNPRISTEGNKKAICNGSALQLDAGTYTGVTYSWSTGEKTQKIKVNAEGTYVVSIKNKNGCEGKDSVYIRVQTAPQARLANPPDTMICEGGSALLRVQGTWSSVRWSNGIPGPSNQVSQEGSYWVSVTDSLGCVGYSDTVQVHVSRMAAQLNGPNSLCAGVDGTFSVDTNSAWTYNWVAGSTATIVGDPTSARISVKWSSQGTDTVRVVITDTRSGCVISKQLPVTISTTLSPTLSIDGVSVLCGNTSTIIKAPLGYDSYVWSSGETTSSITVNTAGRYSVRVVSGGCNGTSDTVEIKSAPPISVSIQGDTSICAGASTVLSASPGFVSYRWSNGDSTSTTTVSTPGSYSVTVRDTNGCETTSSRVVSIIRVNISGSNSLDFNTVLVNQTSTLRYSIPNTNSESITIQDVYIANASPEFKLKSVNPKPPGVLLPNQSLLADLSFSPSDLQSYTDTLVVVISLPCPDTIRIALSGRGTKDSISAVLWMTDVRGASGDEVRLPVFLKFSNNQEYTDVDCRVTVKLNAYIFHPTSISSGTLKSNVVAGRERTISVDLMNATLKSGAKLFDIVGTALTDRDSVAVTSPSIVWLRTISAATQDSSGTLTITGCNGDHFNLVEVTPLSLELSPNPATADVHVAVKSSVDFEHIVRIYHSDGRCAGESRIVPQSGTVDYEATIRGLASGVYVVVVQAGSQFVSRHVTVVN